jgi:hypothetical protein
MSGLVASTRPDEQEDKGGFHMRFRTGLRRLLAVIATALLAAPGHANDTAIGDDNGTVTFKHLPAIAMDGAVPFISRSLVTVDDVFTNTGPVNVPLPAREHRVSRGALNASRPSR